MSMNDTKFYIDGA